MRAWTRARHWPQNFSCSNANLRMYELLVSVAQHSGFGHTVGRVRVNSEACRSSAVLCACTAVPRVQHYATWTMRARAKLQSMELKYVVRCSIDRRMRRTACTVRAPASGSAQRQRASRAAFSVTAHTQLGCPASRRHTVSKIQQPYSMQEPI